MSDVWEQCRLPGDLSYEEWINYIFDHPPLEPEWWWRDTEIGYCQEWYDTTDTTRTLSYLTQLFAEPGELINRFTRAQIDQGLNFIVSESCSYHLYVIVDEKLPWEDRRACLEAMVPLYQKLMAPVYGNDLGHGQHGPSDVERPNYACFMWWDISPISRGMDHRNQKRIDDVVLNVFEQVLELRAESCLESVLHGLGHWHRYIPERTGPIVRQFLTRKDMSPELREYAEYVARGVVQ
jgi:hypothetical protein